MAERIAGYCTLCRSRCGTLATVKDGRLIRVDPLPGHPTGGALCAKGRAAPELIESPLRLTKPLRRTRAKDGGDPGWVEISWDEALDEVAEKVGVIRDRHGAEAVAFSLATPSGTPMVDSSEWVDRFARLFGSPNLLSAVEICGWHKDYAHALTFGRGIGAADYDRADVIVLWGHNPARTWLAQASRVASARRRGAKVVVVDPKPDGSGRDADLWVRVRPGADGALAMGAIRHLIDTKGYDAGFVTRWTNAPMLVDPRDGRLLRASAVWADASAEAFVVQHADGTLRPYDTRGALDEADRVSLGGRGDVPLADGGSTAAVTVWDLLWATAERYSVATVAELTWVPEETVRAFNAAFAGAPRLAYHSWTGVGQHDNATAIERAIATLYALTGACDREGGNLWLVPPPTRPLSDYVALLPAEQRAKALGLDELPLGPPSRGWITARDFARAAINSEPYRVRALMGFGANFVASQAGGARNLAALRSLDFQLHVDMFLTPTANSADIVLPANLPWERDALKIGFEITQAAAETVQFRRKLVDAPGDCRADYEIVAALALRLGMGERFFGGDVEAGWNFQLEPLGVTVDELRARPEGVRFAQPSATEKYAADTGDGPAGFATPTRRVDILSERLLDHGLAALPDHVEPRSQAADGSKDARFPLVLTTAKSGWFTHSSYRHVASLRRKSPEPCVEIARGPAKTRGLREGDWARLSTPSGEVSLKVRINDALDPRVALAEFGWWEACEPLGRAGAPAAGGGAANINAILSDDVRDPVSGSVPLRAVACDIALDAERSRGLWEGERAFRLVSRRATSSDVLALGLEPEDRGPVAPFLPGQHVVTRLAGGGPTRAYSLTSAHGRSGYEIAVRRSPDLDGDHLSHRLHALDLGAEILLKAPAGHFCMPVGSRRPLIFAAGGVGVTPFVSHLRALAADKTDFRAEVVLLHGCTDGASHPYGPELRQLAADVPGVTYKVWYAAPAEADEIGRDHDFVRIIDVAVAEALLPARPLVYLCGSPGFIAAMRGAFAAMDVPPHDVFAEAFSTPSKPPAELKPQTVTIAGGASFEWRPEHGSILDAALGAGHALPSGCRVGQCESCAVKVISGDVAHLGADPELDGACLTCAAVPLSAVTIAAL